MSTHIARFLICIPAILALTACAVPPAGDAEEEEAAAGEEEGLSTSVPVCDGLTLYGNARASGLCKTLSQGNNLWVCELATSPDIHTTFNKTTGLHLTVRSQSCDKNSYFTGKWNSAGKTLKVASGSSASICGVDVAKYATRLNDVHQNPASAGVTACKAGFDAAYGSGKIDAKTYNFYTGLCKANSCQ